MLAVMLPASISTISTLSSLPTVWLRYVTRFSHNKVCVCRRRLDDVNWAPNLI